MQVFRWTEVWTLPEMGVGYLAPQCCTSSAKTCNSETCNFFETSEGGRGSTLPNPGSESAAVSHFQFKLCPHRTKFIQVLGLWFGGKVSPRRMRSEAPTSTWKFRGTKQGVNHFFGAIGDHEGSRLQEPTKKGALLLTQQRQSGLFPASRRPHKDTKIAKSSFCSATAHTHAPVVRPPNRFPSHTCWKTHKHTSTNTHNTERNTHTVKVCENLKSRSRLRPQSEQQGCQVRSQDLW